MTERYSVNVLRECIDLQNKKANDYQNPNSTIKQADYYPSGCLTILEIIQAKVLRMRSVMEAMQNDPNYKPNFESLEDSAKDLINYASFYVAYSRGKVDGQEPDRDFLNRKIDTTKRANVIPREVWFDDSAEKTNEWYGSGFIGEVGDSGSVTHPGVKSNLVDRTVNPRNWSIGARGAD
jgi:hypothetical protein